ncbi:hypothetical protein Purlil1_9824 [Purpureocillium lilacinum]|uniref:Uncharacterized protein n=1 Tax=Purpureocillium lilacinum TaxID=33203 RepID=A0ABR0BPE7_PURLI|nr:hypothetical protein Purlil1_9824 [Purpureocillium lilacinum]
MNSRPPPYSHGPLVLSDANGHDFYDPSALEKYIEGDCLLASDDESYLNFVCPPAISACGGHEARGNTPPPASMPPRLLSWRQTVTLSAAQRGFTSQGFERCRLCGGSIEQQRGGNGPATRRLICKDCESLNSGSRAYVSVSKPNPIKKTGINDNIVRVQSNSTCTYSHNPGSDTYTVNLNSADSTAVASSLSICTSDGGLCSTHSEPGDDRTCTCSSGGCCQGADVAASVNSNTPSTSTSGARRLRQQIDRRD